MSLTLRIPTTLGELGNIVSGTGNKVDPFPKVPRPENYSKIEVLQFRKAVDNEYSWTPDWNQLEQYEYQPVFVYCNATRGGKYHSVIQDISKLKDDGGRSCNPYAVTNRRYEVLQTKDGSDSFPIALPSDAPPLTATPGSLLTGHMSGFVKGRVYLIRSDLLKQLDRFKENGILFDRVRTRVFIPYRIQWMDSDRDFRAASGTGTCMTSEAMQGYGVWMYVGRQDHWDSVPFSGLERCGVSVSKHGSKEPFYLFRHWEIKNK